MYITKEQLRNLGLTQPDSILIKFLEEVNQEVSRRIEQEIPKEIKQNYDTKILEEYLTLREENGFSSSIVQNWLRKNIKAYDEIVMEWKEITLHDIYTAINNQPVKKDSL